MGVSQFEKFQQLMDDYRKYFFELSDEDRIEVIKTYSTMPSYKRAVLRECSKIMTREQRKVYREQKNKQTQKDECQM